MEEKMTNLTFQNNFQIFFKILFELKGLYELQKLAEFGDVNLKLK